MRGMRIIEKNLMRMMLKSKGIEVRDFGTDVPYEATESVQILILSTPHLQRTKQQHSALEVNL